MRRFIINYTRNNDNRSIKVILSKPTGDIGRDAKAAVSIFINAVGNLKKNNITSIQEIDNSGNPIGEVIKPTTEESVILPIKKESAEIG